MATTEYGWCTAHPPYDHMRTNECVDFLSDTEHTAILMAEARERDAQVTHHYPTGTTDAAAHYIATYRPY